MSYPKLASLLVAILVVLTNHAARADDEKDKQEAEEIPATAKKGREVVVRSAELDQFCFFAGKPPPEEEYEVVRRFKVGKGSYGGVKDILPRLASRAQQAGADAVINYTSAQSFGVLPWRVIRPVVGGVGIRWTKPKKRDCEAMGGSTLETILATDEPPGRRKPTKTNSSSVADRLKALDDLRDRKLISPAEYEARRSKILDGL